MKISIVGDVMLSRLIGQKHASTNYSIVSDNIIKHLRKSDYVIANLESPILDENIEGGDHLVFNAKSNTLDQFSYIDFFSLANNHINDCGIFGVENTIEALEARGFDYNGVFTELYKPLIVQKGNIDLVIFTCTDMMNVPIDHSYKVPHFEDEFLISAIAEYKSKGFIVLVYAHVGQLFTRFPNVKIRQEVRKYCDAGADIVLTAHPHVLGGIEKYKGKNIVYSIGDFIMDGNSYRRRRATIIDVEISEHERKVVDIKMTPTIIGKDLVTDFAFDKNLKIATKSWAYVSNILAKYSLETYKNKYSLLYKVEIFNHNWSTIYFIISDKGIVGFFKILFKRVDEVKMMFKWIFSDRSKLTKDDDAIKADRKKFTSDELFK